MSTQRLRVGQVGLGYWGRNLVRVFDDVADLRWLCDASEERRAEFAERYSGARITGDFGELLAADDVDAVVIVTDHSSLDYERLVDEASLVVDLRNATGAKGAAAEHVFKL